MISRRASGPTERLDAAHPGADRRLVQDPHERDLAGAVDVGAAAELARVVPDLDHADEVPVLLAEQRDRALRSAPRPSSSRRSRPASSSASRRLASSSACSRTSCGTAEWCGKSNRRRPGATSEPACRACSPRTWRSVQCRMWVARWARAVASRRAASTSPRSLLALADLAGPDDAGVHDDAAGPELRIGHGDRAARASGSGPGRRPGRRTPRRTASGPARSGPPRLLGRDRLAVLQARSARRSRPSDSRVWYPTNSVVPASPATAASSSLDAHVLRRRASRGRAAPPSGPSNRSSSISNPASAASSLVSCFGKPNVSWSLKTHVARQPLRIGRPPDLASRTASSPAAACPRTEPPPSSPPARRTPGSPRSSGYTSPNRSTVRSTSAGMTVPRSRAAARARPTRRSIRRTM